MDWIPLNWGLVTNPLNWIIILLMLIIAGYVLHLTLPNVFNSPS